MTTSRAGHTPKNKSNLKIGYGYDDGLNCEISLAHSLVVLLQIQESIVFYVYYLQRSTKNINNDSAFYSIHTLNNQVCHPNSVRFQKGLDG